MGTWTAITLMVLSQVGPFRFQGIPASARTHGMTGFYLAGPDPLSPLWERGSGSATLEVQDRIQSPAATYGDEARLRLRFRLGITEYELELDSPGFPPGSVPAGLAGLAAGGGVLLDQPVYGATGHGPPYTPAQAAIAVVGLGRVFRNGDLLTDRALVQVWALSAGIHADDESFSMLPQSRPGDAELIILASGLPRAREPRGFLEFGFDDVEEELNGVALPNLALVPTAGQELPTIAGAPAPYVEPGLSSAVLPAGASVTASAGALATNVGVGPGASGPGPATVATGVPASPVVANSGANPTAFPRAPAPGNELPPTPLPQAIPPANSLAPNAPAPLTANSQPLNATPATPLPGTPVPGNVGGPSLTQTFPSTGFSFGISPANAAPATPLPGNSPANPAGR